MNFDEQPATMLDANLLTVEEGHPVTIIERLRTADGQPVVYCLDKIAKKINMYRLPNEQWFNVKRH